AIFRLEYFRDFLEYVGAVSLALFLLLRARDGELLTAQLGQSLQNLSLLAGEPGWSLDNQVHNLITSPGRIADHGNALLAHNQAGPCLGPGRYLQNSCTLYGRHQQLASQSSHRKADRLVDMYGRAFSHKDRMLLDVQDHVKISG